MLTQIKQSDVERTEGYSNSKLIHSDKKHQIDLRHRRLKRTQQTLQKDKQTKTDTADCEGKDV